MNRSSAFVACVQTAVLKATTVYADEALNLVARAASVPEEHVPADVARAAQDFVRYAHDDQSEPMPEWYARWMESLHSDERPPW